MIILEQQALVEIRWTSETFRLFKLTSCYAQSESCPSAFIYDATKTDKDSYMDNWCPTYHVLY